MIENFTGKDALVLFFGIFWGIIAGVIGRYRLFDTHLFFDQNLRNYALSRFIVGFIIINIAPIGWFCLLYNYFASDKPGAGPIMAAAVSSFSLFGFNRILHAIIATDKVHSKFYSQEEWTAMMNQWGRKGPNTFAVHFVPGIAYMIFTLGIAYLTIWLSVKHL